MPLRFPEVEDIPLERPPLIEVICQVRFPTILSIGRSQPVKFQEAIRQRFPELEEEPRLQLRVVSGSGGAVSEVDASGRVFRFRTRTGDAVVALADESYSISTSNYTVWDAFAKDLALVHEAAISAYDLPYAKRIGLRYVNQLDFDRTGCKTLEELQEFLHPDLAALMRTDAWNQPDELVSQVLLPDSDGRLVLRVAVRTASNESPIVLLDFDYYEEGPEIPLNDLVERCNRYHKVIYRAFRWSLRPDKLVAFKPVVRES